ncbi:hypothetical protein AXK57_21735 [Tsukamurella pulmonis]|uniref:hypothetical protein n=1 Tax=Tsukamurella pulmonis TaxID=47312 RepID=UPI00079350D5|nr:hypothetical protein [Tsukamurella pulmonis]KXP11656.1 hypothetical protein AXK57_21735 [Tsukamurella pulmonis]
MTKFDAERVASEIRAAQRGELSGPPQVSYAQERPTWQERERESARKAALEEAIETGSDDAWAAFREL